MISGPRRNNLAYFLALFLELAVFYKDVLFRHGYLFPWDFRGVHLPLATLTAASLRHSSLPLWDPYTYCGNPIFANIQAALFYPPVLLATLASNWLGTETLPRLLAVAVVMQVFFAGLCTFALMKKLDARPGAGFVAATIYQLGCFFAVHTEHMGAMHGASWIPLAWWSVVELRNQWRWRWVAILSMSLCLSVLSGLPQVAVAAFGSALILALLLGRSLDSQGAVGRRKRLPHLRLPLTVLAAWVWGLALAAVQVIPTAQLTQNSVAKFRADYLKTGGGIKLGALYSLVIPNYWNVFDLSKFHGPSDLTFLYLYCSMLGLALALAAAVWKPDRTGRVFALLTLIATVWMLGDSTPIGATIFQALPVNVRIGIHPEFTLPVFTLGLAVLAGLGAERFWPARWQWVAGAIIAIDLIAVSSGRPFNAVSVAAEPGITHDSIDGSAPLAARLRELTGKAFPAYRFDMADAPYGWSGSAPILEIPTANGCDPMAPERVIQMRLSFAPGERWGTCYQVVNPSSPVIGLENAKYVVSRSPVAGDMLRPVETIAGYTIYENTRTMPRFFLASGVRPVADLAQAARALHVSDFDPSNAIVEGDVTGGSGTPVARPPAVPGSSAAGAVQVVRYESTEIVVQTRAEGVAFLVAADAWYPGWEAAVDGQPVRLYATDAAFRGVQVPAGTHTVTMRFVPRILYWSGALSVFALLAAAVAIIIRSRDRKGAEGEAD